MSEKHFVYILETERNTLYCGYTDDIEKRYQNHIEGKGAKYTRANKPVKLLWSKEFATKSEALKEEYRIKHKLTRAQKLELINSQQTH
ncbi:GIY-YIG nuclease family protein [bacterium]|nr:GIY-YIG nuclease family protein [bacterium]